MRGVINRHIGKFFLLIIISITTLTVIFLISVIFRTLQSNELKIDKIHAELIFSIIGVLLICITSIGGFVWFQTRKRHYRELYNAEVEKHALLRHFEHLVQYANDIIILANNKLQIIDSNDKACETYGYERSEMLTMPLNTLIASNELNNFQTYIETLFDKKSILTEIKHKRKDNSIFIAEVSCRIIDVEGEYFIQSIIRDITERKRNEENLIMAKEKAQQSDRLKTIFLQNMSHEIRTPMNAILGFSELLENNINDPEKVARFAPIIRQRSADLFKLTNDLMFLSQIQAGQIQARIEKWDLQMLMRDILTDQMKQVPKGKENIQLNCSNLSNNGSYLVYTDGARIRHIFETLIQNAYKFTLDGTIDFGYATDSQSHIQYHVRDTGIGIAPEKQSMVFDSFRQSDEGSNRQGGAGLGLTIVKNIIEMLDGDIQLHSEPEKGTSFTFSIPIKTQKIDNRIISD